MAYHNGSYGGTNSVALPAKIKCNGCRQVKNTSSYSSRQQNDLAAHIRATPGFNAATMPFVPCIGCAPQQVVELHCYNCDLDKGLDKFSKVQRRTPDHAICWKCAQERDNYEPGEQDSDQSSVNSPGEDTDDDYAEEDYTLPASTTTDSASGTVRGTYSSRSTGGVPLSNAGSTVGVSTASTAITSRAPSSTLRNVVYSKAEEERQQDSDDDSERFVLSDSE
ncbi:putative Stc1 domain-containing protein [Septoria linicola]|nr:putative Stc1 domain-containing protein [Septoria linicola]